MPVLSVSHCVTVSLPLCRPACLLGAILVCDVLELGLGYKSARVDYINVSVFYFTGEPF